MHLVTRHLCCALATSCCLVSRPCQNYPTHLIDSAVQERTSLRDIFFLKSPFFWMLRLLAAKFSRSVSVPADNVEWILAETDKVEPGKQNNSRPTEEQWVSSDYEYVFLFDFRKQSYPIFERHVRARVMWKKTWDYRSGPPSSPFLVTSSSITSNKRRSVSVKDTAEEKHTKCGECQ